MNHKQNSADEVTKQCQEFIRLYPTRWALTDSGI